MVLKGSNYLSLTIIKLCLVAVFISACSVGSPEGSVVEKLANQFYQAEQKQDIDTALGFFSDKRSPDEWRSHLEHIAKHLGKIESFEFKKMEVNTVFSGRYYMFEYQVKYSSGKDARETLTFFDSVDNDDKAAIVGHLISAEDYNPLF